MLEPKVYWITGLSGAGKTTLGQLLEEKLKRYGRSVVFLDGDDLRKVFAVEDKYKSKDRKNLALKYSRMADLLVRQGFDVVVATISMYHEVHEFNRQSITNYVEIFLDVPIDILIARDQKKLYSRCLKGELTGVMGIDLRAEYPLRPNIVLKNDGTTKLPKLAKTLFEKLDLD